MDPKVSKGNVERPENVVLKEPPEKRVQSENKVSTDLKVSLDNQENQEKQEPRVLREDLVFKVNPDLSDPKENVVQSVFVDPLVSLVKRVRLDNVDNEVSLVKKERMEM